MMGDSHSDHAVIILKDTFLTLAESDRCLAKVGINGCFYSVNFSHIFRWLIPTFGILQTLDSMEKKSY